MTNSFLTFLCIKKWKRSESESWNRKWRETTQRNPRSKLEKRWKQGIGLVCVGKQETERMNLFVIHHLSNEFDSCLSYSSFSFILCATVPEIVRSIEIISIVLFVDSHDVRDVVEQGQWTFLFHQEKFFGEERNKQTNNRVTAMFQRLVLRIEVNIQLRREEWKKWTLSYSDLNCFHCFKI